MARTALAIEREIEDARSIRDTGVSVRERRINLFSSSWKKKKNPASYEFQGRDRDYQGQGQTKASSQLGPMTCYYCHQLGHFSRD